MIQSEIREDPGLETEFFFSLCFFFAGCCLFDFIDTEWKNDSWAPIYNN